MDAIRGDVRPRRQVRSLQSLGTCIVPRFFQALARRVELCLDGAGAHSQRGGRVGYILVENQTMARDFTHSVGHAGDAVLEPRLNAFFGPVHVHRS